MPPEPCQEFSRKLSAYMDGELPAEDRKPLEDHLSSCASCAEELRALRGADSALLALPAVEPSPFFAARTAAAARSAGRYSAPLLRFLRLPLPAMALMLALIMVNVLSFSVNISAMEPAARKGLIHKVVSCMQDPKTLVNPAALVKLCNDCGDYICACMKECDMKAGKKCPICNTAHMEKR